MVRLYKWQVFVEQLANWFQYIISNSLGGNLPATIPLVITFSLMQDPGSPPLIPFLPATTCAGSTNCNNPAADFPLSFLKYQVVVQSFNEFKWKYTDSNLFPGSVPVCARTFQFMLIVLFQRMIFIWSLHGHQPLIY